MPEPEAFPLDLDGTWSLVHVEQGGIVGQDPDCRMVVQGSQFVLYRKEVVNQTGRLVSGFVGPPYAFEVKDDTGPVYVGIMDKSYGHLRYCVAIPGSPAPTSWLDSKGPRQITCIWVRIDWRI